MSGELIRSFVALHPPEAVSRELERLLTRLSPLAPLKWVNRQQLHITLKFLGERSPELTAKALDALSKITFDPFEIKIDRVGAFPNMNAPRVLWLGCGSGTLGDRRSEPPEKPRSGPLGDPRSGAKELAALASRVEDAMASVGIERDMRPFRAHLTLARCGGAPLPAALKTALDSIGKQLSGGASGLSWTCSSMSLMRSVLTPRGPIYTAMDRKCGS